MFGSAFELRVKCWGSKLVFSLSPSFSPRRHVSPSLSWKYVYTYTNIRILIIAELPPDTRSDDVSKFFDGYGKIIDCRVMTGQSLSPFTVFFVP